jgi:hypothetical protein
MEDWVHRFARTTLGGADARRLRTAAFVLVDVPLAAVRPHLQRREAPPPFVDELIRTTFSAVVRAQGARERNGRARKARKA